VTLPYQHQGGAEHGIAPSTMNNNLFFIDEDDPDWDDDDLDDDLDI
jgi:elongator complex protein 5